MSIAEGGYYTQYHAKFSRVFPDEKTAVDEACEFIRSNVVRVINGTNPMIYTREIDVDSGDYYYAESHQPFNGRLPGSGSKVLYYTGSSSLNSRDSGRGATSDGRDSVSGGGEKAERDGEGANEAREVASKVLADIAKDRNAIPVYEYANFEPLAPFERNVTPPNVFNRFTQLAAVRNMKNRPDDHARNVELTVYHIKEVLCGGCVEVFGYVMSYLAHIVQYPRKKPPSSLVFISSQGVGKNLFFDAFVSRVIGLRWAGVYDDIAHLLGRFNGHLEGKLLCVLDEAKNCRNTAAQESDINKLKAFITRSNIVIERKGKDVGSVAIRDYNRLIILSNNNTPVRIENTDRRFCVVRCRDPVDVPGVFARARASADSGSDRDNGKADSNGSEKGAEKAAHDRKSVAMSKRKYFDDLAEEIASDKWAGSFAYVLMARDLTGWNPADIPDTAEKRRMKLEGLSNVVNFAVNYVGDSLPDVCDVAGEVEDGWIDKQKCYAIYRKYCSYSSDSARSQRDFDAEMVAMCGPVRRSPTGSRPYMFNVDKAKLSGSLYAMYGIQ